MSLQITDGNWELVRDLNLDSAIAKYSLGKFTQPFVAVAIAAPNANPIWSNAGSVAQAIAIDDNLAYTLQTELSLDGYNLLNFEALSGNEYELFYFSLPRLGQINLKLWEYQGQTKNVLTQQLVDAIATSDFLSQDLTKLEQKIDLLLSNQDDQVALDLKAVSDKLDRIITALDLDDSNQPEPEVTEELLQQLMFVGII